MGHDLIPNFIGDFSMTGTFVAEVRATCFSLRLLHGQCDSCQHPPGRSVLAPTATCSVPFSAHAIVTSCLPAFLLQRGPSHFPSTLMHMQKFFLERQSTAEGVAVTFRTDADTVLDDLVSALAASPANEMDGRVSDAMRNNLFGLDEGQDLVGRNIFRSRDVALPTYAGLAQCFGITPDATVRPTSPLPAVVNCSCMPRVSTASLLGNAFIYVRVHDAM